MGVVTYTMSTSEAFLTKLKSDQHTLQGIRVNSERQKSTNTFSQIVIVRGTAVLFRSWNPINQAINISEVRSSVVGGRALNNDQPAKLDYTVGRSSY